MNSHILRRNRYVFVLLITMLTLLTFMFVAQTAVMNATPHAAHQNDEPQFTLVKDINATTADARIEEIVEVNGFTYFISGHEYPTYTLWRTDGTPNGTSVVKSFMPESGVQNVYSLRRLDNLLTFITVTDRTTLTLWRSDGTTEGTAPLKTFQLQDGFGFGLGEIFTTGNHLFFVIVGNNGNALWRSDGTTDGTFLLSEERAISPRGMMAFNNKLIFIKCNVQSAATLWQSDGTVAGTTMVTQFSDRDICSQNLPLENAVFDDKLFFAAHDGVHGVEVWRTDGTMSGTALVKDIWPAENDQNRGSYPTNFTPFNGLLYFSASAPAPIGGALWQSDGTTDGTIMVANEANSDLLGVSDIAATDHGLLMAASSRDHGRELWFSDGTASGTTLLKDIELGTSSSYPDHLTSIGGTVYFTAESDALGEELWRSDGTAVGTTIVADFMPGEASSRPWLVSAVDGAPLVIATGPQYGRELYRVVGNELHLLRDLNTNTASSLPWRMRTINGVNYFTADDGIHGEQLWRTDGTAEGTQMLSHIVSDRDEIDHFTPYKGAIYFVAHSNAHGPEIWKTDGTVDSTIRVTDIISGAQPWYDGPNGLTAVGDLLYFTMTAPDTGRELWQSDGTAAGTMLASDIYTGPESSNPGMITPLGNGFFFFATHPSGNDGSTPNLGLWKSTDGTAANIIHVKDLLPVQGYTSAVMSTQLGDIWLVGINDGGDDVQLWRTDGTADGTFPIPGLRIQPVTSQSIVASDGIAYVAATGSDNNIAIWRTDGTVAGTMFVKELTSGGTYARTRIEVTDGLLYAITGGQLWISDGTTVGTTMIHEFGHDLIGSIAVNGQLFYSAHNSREDYAKLWRAEGQTRTWQLLSDTIKRDMYNLRETLFFLNSTDGAILLAYQEDAIGVELWKMTIPTSPVPTMEPATRTPTPTQTPIATATPTLAPSTAMPTNTVMPTTTPSSTATASPHATATPNSTSGVPTATQIPTDTTMPTETPTPTTTATPPSTTSRVIYLSASQPGQVGDFYYGDEDILAFTQSPTNRASTQWSMLLDGSDIDLQENDIDAFAFATDGSLLFSLAKVQTIDGVGRVDDSDILQFTPTTLGWTTSGTLSLYLRGSDVGLTAIAEDITALHQLADGTLLFSTMGNVQVGSLTAQDEDVLALTLDRTVNPPQAKWAVYFDGTRANLTHGAEDVRGLWLDEAVPDMVHLSTKRAFDINNAQGDGNDIFACGLKNIDANADCNFMLLWDGAGAGLSAQARVNAFAFNAPIAASTEPVDHVIGQANPNSIDEPDPGEVVLEVVEDPEDTPQPVATPQPNRAHEQFLPFITK